MLDNILLLDTSIGTDNIGDEIIMECTRKELDFLLSKSFTRNLPTHVSPFHWYQVWRKSKAIQSYTNSKYKFVGGSNILIPRMLTHYPQWNINMFNYQPLKDCILVGVGAGRDAENGSNYYTRLLYKKLLNHTIYHSARDERSKRFMEYLGVKAINTGCVTMWMMTPDFCRTIPTKKSDTVVFTFTASSTKDERDQYIIDTLRKHYKQIYFFPQCLGDYEYMHKFDNINDIHILPASKDAYDKFLTDTDTDYVGTRLHGGIYALRHQRRAIIIAIDERARSINADTNLPCVDKNNIKELEQKILSDFTTDIHMDFDKINQWKSQFN